MTKNINVKLTQKDILNLARDGLAEKPQIVIEFTGYQSDLFRIGRYLTKHLPQNVVETPQYTGKKTASKKQYHIMIRRRI